MTAAELATIAATPAETWPAQRAPQSGWIPPPILTYQPPARFPDAIVAASQPADPLPVQRLPSVVSTFPAVSQPPVRGAQAPLWTIVAAWTDPPSVPRSVPSAAWNVPPIVAVVPAPSLLPLPILSAWVDVPVSRQPLVQIAPLLAVPAMPAPTPLALPILSAWVDVPVVRQPVVQIAPLLAPSVSQPIPQAFLNPAELAQAVASWPADLEPRLSRPNDTTQKIAPLTLAYGQAPPPRAFLSVAQLTAIAATGPEAWGPQTEGHSASWLPSIVVPIGPRHVTWLDKALTSAGLTHEALTSAGLTHEALTSAGISKETVS